MTTAQSSEQLRTSFMFNGAFSSLLFRSYPHGQITIPEIEFSTSLSLSLSLCVCVCVCVWFPVSYSVAIAGIISRKSSAGKS